MFEEKEIPTKTRDQIISWVSNPLFNLTFPLATTILDQFYKPDQTDVHKYIKRPALLSASIGASLGILLCTPWGRAINRLASLCGSDYTTHFDKLSDSFHQAHNTAGFAKGEHLSNIYNVFLCIFLIAALTIAFKSLGAIHGFRNLQNTLDPEKKLIKNPWLMGLKYGFFGDSVVTWPRKIKNFPSAFHKFICGDPQIHGAIDSALAPSDWTVPTSKTKGQEALNGKITRGSSLTASEADETDEHRANAFKHQ